MQKQILASIIIPVYNKCDYTKHCLESLVENISESYFDRLNADFEVIIVDNASTDKTKDFLKTINGTIKIITNDTNLGFSKACNLGAKNAEGKYIVLLNNDTVIKPNWLESLIDFMEKNPQAGACGSKLLTKDGLIQEAGNVVLNDGNIFCFGSEKNAFRPQYNKICEVDYCSGASLCVRKDLWDKIGGFDEESYSPAYYEDVDLCFAIRKEGFKVYYNPKSELYHYENITSKTIFSKEKLNNIIIKNRAIFKEKWQNELIKHIPYNLTPTTQDRNVLLNPIYQKNLEENKKVLVYFSYALYPISSGAHARILDVMQEFMKIGYEITLFSTTLYDVKNENKNNLLELYLDYGIKTIMHVATSDECYHAREIDWRRINSPNLKIHFKDIYNHLKPDVVIMNYAYDADIIDFNFCKNSVNIIDMLDCITISNKIMDYTREGIEFIQNETSLVDILTKIEKSKYYDLFDANFINHQKIAIDQTELDAYNKFDITLAISKKEQALINDNNSNKNAIFVPQTYEPKEVNNTYIDSPIFLVGPSPLNIHGYLFFALKVLPIILKEEPNFKLKVFGNAALKYPKFDGIELVGYINNLDDIYQNASFSISPLLVGTGQQIKIVESMSYGVPVVMLDALKDSAPVTHEKDGLLAKDEYEFAKYCIKLFRDRNLAYRLGQNAKKKTIALLQEKKNYFNNLFSQIEQIKNKKNAQNNLKTDITFVSMPLVSVIMPVYNKAKYLPESIESVINQDYKNVELIIVNDGSVDDSLKVAQNEIQKYKGRNITLYNKENLGVAHTRNYGFFRAKGDYFMNFDADDILCPTYISKCMEQIKFDKADVCFTNLELFGNKQSEWIPNNFNRENIKFENTIPSSAIFKNIFFALTKGQKVALGFGEDWEFWVNMSRFNIKVTRVPQKLYRYRVVDKGINATYLEDSYDDTLVQVMLNNADLYRMFEVVRTINYVPKMQEKSLKSINRLCKLHPYEWYPYFINGVISEAKGEYEKAVKLYNLSSNLTNNTNILPILRWGFLTRTHNIPLTQDEKFN